MRVWSEALAEQSISVGAEAQILGLGVSAFANEVESEALALSEEAEHGAFEAPRFEEYFGSVVFAHDDADSRCSVVDLDDALHQTFSTLPALMQDVHTRALRELEPCLTRIF
jgi:hypothetical protein